VIYPSYAAPDSTLSVTDVKTVMKDLQLKANLLDSNLTKQKAEIESLQLSLLDVQKEAANFQTWSQRFSKAGYHYFRVLHYNEKAADLIDVIQQRLDYCARYIKQCDLSAVETLPQLRKVYTDAINTLDGVESPLLGMRGRSSSQ
jgi:CII-binding regulator of phage lambda lysogenization HflD